MPLVKKSAVPDAASLAYQAHALSQNLPPIEDIFGSQTVEQKPVATRQKEMTKDDYWRRREERDIETSKNMAWSGLAQAALTSVSVAQLNVENTEDGLVALVARITDKLLKARNS